MNSSENVLISAGLSKEQSLVYSALLEHNYMEAGKISIKVGLDRTFVYKVLGQLADLGLVEKNEKLGKIAKFIALHPARLKDLLDSKKKSMESAQNIVEAGLGNLISVYNLNSGKPNVSFHEGIEGVRKIYRDILMNGQEVFVVKSVHDTDDNEVAELKRENYKRRIDTGIKTTILAPIGHQSLEYASKSSSKFFVGYSISTDKLSIPAQILVYGDKVAIIDFKGEIISTLIENPDVATSIKAIFNLLILLGKKEF
ncbi:MAG: helix-turn-helix domain-containing protein [Candidatus Paceibacterota bacterium]|jgi:sugar-specific transcriptional regulator TrmB